MKPTRLAGNALQPSTTAWELSLRQTASLHVCPLRRVQEISARISARHLISAIDDDLLPETPRSIAPDRHLRLTMHDIIEPRAGLVLPDTSHVLELLEFVHSWNRKDPMLIHCYAGISRSTAAAFIALCALNSNTSEELIATSLRLSSDTATPNCLFVAYADKTLRREGRMIAAVAKIGSGRIAAECSPFALSSHYGDAPTDPGLSDHAQTRAEASYS